jgi:rod shape determining protein RodA
MQMIDIRWDRLLVTLAIVMGLIGVGIVTLATADEPWTVSDYAQRQFVYLLIGILVIWLFSKIDYRFICRYSWWLYGGALALLLVVLVVGRVIGGSQRWIELGPVRIQPSEFAKLALVFTLADAVLRVRNTFGWVWASLAGIIITIPPMLLILMQPDLGTALVFIAIWFGLLFFGGINLRILLGYVVFGALLIPAAMPFLKPYQRARLTAFLNPDADPLGAGYQIIQSKIAIGHGGLFGQGLFQGSQNSLGFIPGEHTDFIFAIAAEELGIVGAGLILLGLLSIVLVGIAVSEVTDDMLAKMVSGGLIAMLAFQAVVNVGITLGLLPVTGIPLPFISYGGSAMLTNCAAVGMLVSIYRHAATKGRMMLIRGI